MIKMSTDWTLPDVPKIQAQPPKPFPVSIQDLIAGITKENLNYGSNPLLQAELHNNKQQLAQGLNQGLNFGVPQIAELQKQELINRQNQAPQIATVEPMGQVQQPIQSTTPQIIPAQKQSFFNSPTGRGILATILGTISGQGLLPSIGSGVAVGFGRKQNLDNDANYRNMYPELQGHQGLLTPEEVQDYLEQKKLKEKQAMEDKLYQLREQELQARIDKQTAPPVPKVGSMIKASDLMATSPELKDQWGKQYDFSNGRNQDFLNKEIPTSIAKLLIPKQPQKRVSTSTVIHKGGSNNSKLSGNNNPKPKKNVPKSFTKNSFTREQALAEAKRRGLI